MPVIGSGGVRRHLRGDGRRRNLRGLGDLEGHLSDCGFSSQIVKSMRSLRVAVAFGFLA
jgi:hypothetical protein